MFDPPLQMPMPKRQFATPTPSVTPNPTPAASRTTSSVSIGNEQTVDEIREILLGQRLTPDPFSADPSATAQVTRQFSAMVLESTGLCCCFFFHAFYLVFDDSSCDVQVMNLITMSSRSSRLTSRLWSRVCPQSLRHSFWRGAETPWKRTWVCWLMSLAR